MLRAFLICLFVLPSYTCLATDIYTLKIDAIGKLSIQVDEFSATTVNKCGEYICVIDNNFAYGSDGNTPLKQVSKIIYTNNGTEYILNSSGMYDPAISSENISERIDISPFWGGFYKITGSFSDGTGSYIVQWIVGNSSSQRQFIGASEELADLFYWLDDMGNKSQ